MQKVYGRLLLSQPCIVYSNKSVEKTNVLVLTSAAHIPTTNVLQEKAWKSTMALELTPAPQCEARRVQQPDTAPHRRCPKNLSLGDGWQEAS